MVYSRRDLPLNALRAFEAVARTRSFTAAAANLNVAQSAVSRHIARLEEILGRRLFDRSAKAVRLTDAGEYLVPIVQRSFEAMARGLDHVGHAGGIKLHVPPAYVQTTGLPFVQQFKDAYSEIPLTIMTTNAVGRPSDDYDLAIVFDEMGEGSPQKTLLAPIIMKPVCSRQSAERLREAGLAEALRSEDLLHVKLDGYEQDHLWRKLAQGIGIRDIKSSALAFDTAALAVEFAKAGAGMALGNASMTEADLQTNGLAAPFELEFETGFGYYLIQSRSSRHRPGVQELRQLIEAARLPDPSARKD